MTQPHYRWLAAVCLAVATAWLAGCNPTHQDHRMTTNTAWMPAMRTHCVGRFLIDLPEGFEQTPGSDVELIYGLDENWRSVGVEVLRSSGAEPTLEALVARREVELGSQYHDSSPSKTMLALKRRLNDETVLIRAYDSHSMVEYFKSQIFAQTGTAIGLFTSKVYLSEPADAVEIRLSRVAARTSFAESPVQAGRGTCLGPLVIDAGQDGERFSVNFKHRGLPDVRINIDINSLLAESDGGLLKRWDSKAGALAKMGFTSTTLRRGQAGIGGMDGEELLNQGKERDRVARAFHAETLLTKPATFSAPSLAIHMNMGGQIESGEYRDASWAEDEAMAIWDAIVKSIRLRPGAV